MTDPPVPSRRFRGLREEGAQIGILTKHFFQRLFRNDIVDFEDQMKARLIAVLSILAVIVGWSSYFLIFFKYEFSPDLNTSWQDKNYVFLFVMIIFGIVTLLEWEVLFPDRRDFVNLTPLPVRLRTIFAAKLASFIAFIGLFSVAMNSFSSVAFALFLAQWRSNSVLFLVRHVFAHLISAFAACFCVFFACVFVNFFLMALLPSSLYRRVSLLVRFALIGFFIFLLLTVLVEPGSLSGVVRSLANLKDHGSPPLFRVPSLWFVGLYEVLLGTTDPVFKALARTAGLAFGLSIGAFGLACALSYLKHFRTTLETAKRERRLRRLREGVANALQRTVLWNPEERAVGAFFSKTIRSSPKHRTVLVNCLALGAALVTLSIVANRRDLQALTSGNSFFLAQSLLLAFILLAGTPCRRRRARRAREQLGLPGDGIRRKGALCLGPQEGDPGPMGLPPRDPDLFRPPLALGGLAAGPGSCGLCPGRLGARHRSPLLSFQEDPLCQRPCPGKAPAPDPGRPLSRRASGASLRSGRSR